MPPGAQSHGRIRRTAGVAKAPLNQGTLQIFVDCDKTCYDWWGNDAGTHITTVVADVIALFAENFGSAAPMELAGIAISTTQTWGLPDSATCSGDCATAEQVLVAYSKALYNDAIAPSASVLRGASDPRADEVALNLLFTRHEIASTTVGLAYTPGPYSEQTGFCWTDAMELDASGDPGMVNTVYASLASGWAPRAPGRPPPRADRAVRRRSSTTSWAAPTLRTPPLWRTS